LSRIADGGEGWRAGKDLAMNWDLAVAITSCVVVLGIFLHYISYLRHLSSIDKSLNTIKSTLEELKINTIDNRTISADRSLRELVSLSEELNWTKETSFAKALFRKLDALK
jgi:hypothetical protein